MNKYSLDLGNTSVKDLNTLLLEAKEQAVLNETIKKNIHRRITAFMEFSVAALTGLYLLIIIDSAILKSYHSYIILGCGFSLLVFILSFNIWGLSKSRKPICTSFQELNIQNTMKLQLDDDSHKKGLISLIIKYNEIIELNTSHNIQLVSKIDTLKTVVLSSIFIYLMCCIVF